MSWYDTNLVLIQATMTGLLLALSIQVPLRMGVFSFAGVGAYGIGSYGAAVLVVDHGADALTAMAVPAVLGASLLVVLGLVVHRLSGLTLGMATIAFDLIVSVVAVNWRSVTGGSVGRYGVLADYSMGLMWTVFFLVVALVAVSELGRTGRRTTIVREDPELAASLGIRVRRYRLASFAVSGALGALSGAMNILFRTAITPVDLGFHLVVLALTMIIVGGAMSWRGAVLGAVTFTWLPEVLSFVGEWQELIYGALVAVAAIFLPRGVYGAAVSLGRRVSGGRRRQARLAGAGEGTAVSETPWLGITPTELDGQR